jgi:hypothetical protein
MAPAVKRIMNKPDIFTFKVGFHPIFQVPQAFLVDLAEIDEGYHSSSSRTLLAACKTHEVLVSSLRRAEASSGKSLLQHLPDHGIHL